MSPPLVPVDLVPDLLDAHLARYDVSGHGLYTAVLLLVAGTAAALPVVRVDVLVQASGIVRPALEKHEVRAARAGTVARLLVQDGARVARGAVLLALDPAAVRARAGAIDERLRDARADLADLTALAARAARAGAPLGAATLRTPRRRAERARHEATLNEARLRVAAAAVRARRTAALASRALASVAEAEADRAAAAEAEAALATVARRQESEWAAALAVAREQLAALVADSAAAAHDADDLLVRAPVDGTVEQVARVAAGSFVAGGAPVAVVSPDRALVAELWVPPRDVGRLRVGGPARVQVDAFAYTDWGAVPARIVSISDDYVDVDGRPAFRVRCALASGELTLPNGARGRVRKGMTVRAHFPVARRSLLALLRGGAAGWLDPTQRREPARAS